MVARLSHSARADAKGLVKAWPERPIGPRAPHSPPTENPRSSGLAPIVMDTCTHGVSALSEHRARARWAVVRSPADLQVGPGSILGWATRRPANDNRHCPQPLGPWVITKSIEQSRKRLDSTRLDSIQPIDQSRGRGKTSACMHAKGPTQVMGSTQAIDGLGKSLDRSTFSIDQSLTRSTYNAARTESQNLNCLATLEKWRDRGLCALFV